MPGKVLIPMPIALSSLIVGDWKSLLSNLGGTGPDPTLGRSAEAVMLPVDEVVVLPVDEVVVLPVDEVVVLPVDEMVVLPVDEVVVLPVDEVVVLPVDAAVLEEVEGLTGSADTEGELEPGVQEGSLVAGVVGDKTATLPDETGMVGADKSEALDCAFLACFLAAALVCHPHEHGLFAVVLKKDPCRHFSIEVIAAQTSLLDGFLPLPVNTGRPSARSINCSAYCPMPRKWCDFDIS